MLILNYAVLFLPLGVAMFLSVRKGKLTIAGSLTGGLIGLLIFLGAGFYGIAMIGAFFILGTAATSWKMDYKQAQNLAEKNKGQRTAGQVIANGGVAGIAGLLAYLLPQNESMFRLMMAASLSAATADTLSSELGMVYGRNCYNILTFKKDQKGRDGVVSREGTAFGIAGSIVIALIYALGFGWNIYLIWIIIAGTVGNLSDSVLGATLERQHVLNNNAVNFLNTFIGALRVALLYAIFK